MARTVTHAGGVRGRDRANCLVGQPAPLDADRKRARGEAVERGRGKVRAREVGGTRRLVHELSERERERDRWNFA